MIDMTYKPPPHQSCRCWPSAGWKRVGSPPVEFRWSVEAGQPSRRVEKRQRRNWDTAGRHTFIYHLSPNMISEDSFRGNWHLIASYPHPSYNTTRSRKNGGTFPPVILLTWDDGSEIPLMNSAKGNMFGVIGLCFSYVLSHSLDGPNARIGRAQMLHSF